MNVTSTNHGLQAEVSKEKEEKNVASVQQEKEWINSIVEMQRNEDQFTKQKKREQIEDLSRDYIQHALDRKEQG